MFLALRDGERTPHVQLDLGDNKLKGGVDELKRCPSLRHISLVGNKIDSLDELKALVSNPLPAGI